MIERLKSILKRQYCCLLRPRVVSHFGVRLDLSNEAVGPHIRRVVYSGGYEAQEASILFKTLKIEDRVLEIGAGMGFVSIFAAKLLGDGSRIMSVEALPQMEVVIRNNYVLNKCNPNLLMAAVGTENGELEFTVADEFWSSSLSREGKSGSRIRVPSRKLGDLASDFQPSYLVVDVEGAEETLFQENLGPVKRICLEVHPHYIGNRGVQRCLQDLAQQGFAVDFRLSNRCLLYLEKEDP